MKFTNINFLLLAVLFAYSCVNAQIKTEKPMQAVVKEALDFAVDQSKYMAAS